MQAAINYVNLGAGIVPGQRVFYLELTMYKYFADPRRG
jgi:hypothetical protein